MVERAGRIMVMRDGETLARPFLTIPGGVSTAGEGGLLSMVFHPDYEENRRFYVLYTRLTKDRPTGGVIRVDEFRRYPGAPESRDPRKPAERDADRALDRLGPLRRAAPVRAGRAAARHRRDAGIELPPFSLVSFGEDGLGRLYVISISDGRVYRVKD